MQVSGTPVKSISAINLGKRRDVQRTARAALWCQGRGEGEAKGSRGSAGIWTWAVCSLPSLLTGLFWAGIWGSFGQEFGSLMRRIVLGGLQASSPWQLALYTKHHMAF